MTVKAPAGAAMCTGQSTEDKLVQRAFGPIIQGERRSKETLVFAATLNEFDCVPLLLDQIFAQSELVDVLIIDDSSTDGTIQYLEERATIEPRLNVIVRHGRPGLGSAHKMAWTFAREKGYARLITMDADLSHDPADIPRFLKALDGGAAFVVGSRFMPGGLLGYRGWRRLLSVGANTLASYLLGLPNTEYTSSYRAANLGPSLQVWLRPLLWTTTASSCRVS